MGNNNYEIIPGIISVFKKENEYYIYDGAHRYEAAKKIPDMKMLISVLDEEDDVEEEFENVNKSVPVPECYLKEGDNHNTRLCEDLVNHYAKKYPKFVSTSFRCRKPNFNRDNLIDLLNKSLVTSNMASVIDLLTEINDDMRDSYNGKKENSQFKKCEKYNCWIFCMDNDEMTKRLKELL